MSGSVLGNFYNRLGKREKRVLTALGLVLLLILGYRLIVSPFMEKMAWYDRMSRQGEKDLAEWVSVKKAYLNVNGRVGRIEARASARAKDFSFPVFLESAAAEIKIKNRMTSLSPLGSQAFENLKVTSLEIKLEEVTLQQAVLFISRIEKAPVFLSVSHLEFKTRYSDSRNLDVTLIVAHYEKTS